MFGIGSILGGGGGLLGLGNLFKGDFGGFLDSFMSGGGLKLLGLAGGPWAALASTFASGGGFSDLVNGNGIQSGVLQAIMPNMSGMFGS